VNRKTVSTLTVLAFTAVLVLSSVAASVYAAPRITGGPKPTKAEKRIIEMRKKAAIARNVAWRNTRITQKEREAAADRARLKALAAKKSAIAGGLGAGRASALPKPGPGGTPDYFSLDTPNWAFSPPLRKFVDGLPGLGPDKANNLGQYLSVAKPDTTSYPGSDYYVIALRQYTEKLHSDLPSTTLRGYVQLNNGTDVNGDNTLVPDPIHYLGPTIIAEKDRPVRIKFVNQLATGTAGDLFIPVDTTVMGAGEGPLGAAGGKYTQNRATLHLHGGRTPWISDGTAHQWITPAGEDTPYPKGVSVQNVPDMPDPGDGSMTFYYTNQQSARLMFYHDHSFGITRLNVFAGEAAPYLLSDDVEKQLVNDGIIPADQIPLVVQDKTFVDASTIATTDPTWNWGSTPGTPHTGDLWWPHVYMPAQNPYDLTGTAPMGRWMYGPWFWPPTTNIAHGPVDNPYYDPLLAPWEPPEAPGTPDNSMGMEAFMDTAMVNGTAFPTTEVSPKSYRLRVLNASNDRFFNLQMYEADPTTMSADGRSLTEVKMVPAERTTPGIAGTSWPTDGREGGVPDPATKGPQWIQIGTEGGFLPAPAVIDQQPITWNRNPTTFNAGNVELHSLLLGPAERADVIVDFSAYAGKTLILYNDAPAAFPALDPRYDYYTGAPDQTDTGGHSGPQVGFGPNTRTVMQIKVASSTPETPAAPAFDLARLEEAFASTDTTPGVFAKSQDPILVAQSAYNSAYNKLFPTRWPFWGYARIQDTSMKIMTSSGTTLTIPLQPKAIHDEMGAAFDKEYGRMSGNLGVELPNTNALQQMMVLYGYSDPATEKLKESTMETLTPVLGDGTQIWKITHNGVDTHPIHFHLFDVQLINRVGWDGMIRLPDANELGWKDTVRISPLEDTIVALRPVKPKVPFGVPDSVRPYDPTMPLGIAGGLSQLDPITGQAVPGGVVNTVVNFGWEYAWHCHILSHEEMDMMRPITFDASRTLSSQPPLDVLRTDSTAVLTWTDPTPPASASTLGNPMNEIGFRIERATVVAGVVGTYSPIGKALANATTFTDGTSTSTVSFSYRVVAYNAAGEAFSNAVQINGVYRRYEQDEPRIAYTGTWPTMTKAGPSNGSYKYINSTGSAKLLFKGTDLTLLATKYSGYGKARVTLDAGTPEIVDLYAPTWQYQQPVWAATGLTDTTHSVTFEWTGTKNALATNTYVDIDAVEVNGTLLTAYPITRYEQTDPLIVKTGPWNTLTVASASAGSFGYLNAIGSATATFTGTGIDVITTTRPGYGIAAISIDGGNPTMVDLNTAAIVYKSRVFTVRNLAPSTHTIKIEWTGMRNALSTNTYVTVDALDVEGLLTP
jgi:FtsP/CotA-like multicopper oxidase with cupredoxin domain